MNKKQYDMLNKAVKTLREVYPEFHDRKMFPEGTVVSEVTQLIIDVLEIEDDHTSRV